MASEELTTHAKQLPELSSTHRSVAQDLDLSSRLLKYLSEASGETIGALLVACVAVVCLVFGRFGFLLVGVLAGVALHATWERQGFVGEDRDGQLPRKNEMGLEVVTRLLGRQRNASSSQTSIEDVKAQIAMKITTGEAIDLQRFPAEVASAVNDLADGVVANYVKYWYSPMLPRDDQFPQASRQALIAFLLALGTHQCRRRPADAFLTFMTNAVSVFIVFLNELSLALMSDNGSDLETPEALSLYLEKHPNSNLGSMMDRAEQEKRFLAISDDILQAFLDHKTYNCFPAQVFLRKVLGNVALESIVQTIADPHWINSWIIHALEEGEPELLNVIDAGVGHATSGAVPLATANAGKAIDGESYINLSRSSNSGVATTPDVQEPHSEPGGHDAMQAAVEEARRLTQMIRDHESSVPDAGNNDSSIILANDGDHSGPESNVPTTGSRVVEQPALDEFGAGAHRTGSSTNSVKSFTSFDQIVPVYRPMAESVKGPAPLTLHNARITLLDDALSGDRNTLRGKPLIEFLIQVEPFSSAHSGWMVVRPFIELEPLHEYLYKIANVSGAPAFARQYQYLPSFKGKTREDLRQDMEKYLSDALSYETLAESEGMKRFLDKDQGFKKSNAGKTTLKFATPVGDAFQTVGKGVLGSFNSATKGVAAGGQAVFEGVGGLFAGPKKQSGQSRAAQSYMTSQESPSTVQDWIVEERTSDLMLRQSLENDSSLRTNGLDAAATPVVAQTGQPARVGDEPTNYTPPSTARGIKNADPSSNKMPAQVLRPLSPTIPSTGKVLSIDSDVNVRPSTSAPSFEQGRSRVSGYAKSVANHDAYISRNLDSGNRTDFAAHTTNNETRTNNAAPLDESETRVAIELMFAAINELFTLSSAWNIRRALLNAAKNYLLRPGNPTLVSIKDLLQNSLDENLAAANVASYIQKIRESSVPTETELANWPAAPGVEQKDALRTKARELLLNRGMPQALASVMGATASREALSRVFDALQVEDVARGLMSAIFFQAVKTIVN